MTTVEPSTETWAAARWYARQGIYVFPCHSITASGQCSCRHADCSSVGKHPRTKNGVKDATTDLATIDRWWSMWPNANVAIAAGMSGWAVIDIDPDHGGSDSLHDLERQYGKIPDTVRSITGGGGAHLVLQRPAMGFRPFVSIAPGIDTRGDDSYILAPPSNHISGGSYVWEADRRPGEFPLAQVPLWFLGEMERSRSTSRVLDDQPGAVIDKGRRDKVLASLAGTMRSRGMTVSEIYAALSTINDERVRPPLPTADIQRIASSIGRYEADAGAYTAEIDETSPEPYGASLINWQEFWQIDPKGEDWLLQPVIPRGRSIAIYSPAKQGKSLLALDIAVHLATGEPMLDSPRRDPVEVVYFDLEMTENDLYERLMDMGYGPHSDLSHFHYYLLPNLPPLDTPDGGLAVLEIVQRHQGAVAFIDTTSRVLRGPENDADTLRALYMYTGLPLKAANITVIRLDHAGKDVDRGQRGSSAKNDDVDLVWLLTSTEHGVILRATHRRQSWVPEEVPMVRMDDPLRHVHGVRSWPAGTSSLSDKLDEIGVPVDTSERAARQIMKAHGISAANEVFRAALRWRREKCAENSAAHFFEAETAQNSAQDDFESTAHPRRTPAQGLPEPRRNAPPIGGRSAGPGAFSGELKSDEGWH